MALLWHSRDARLVDELRRGRREAFEQIYARHQPAILSFCRHLTGNREDAEDAVQHTFLSAYCQIAESDGTLELRPWLFAVARNRCLSLLRARTTRGTVALDDAAHATDGLTSEVEQRQELRELVGDLSRLPEQQRAALLLAQLDDMSHREIGAVLGVAPAKVKALVFQARSSLASAREAREASCSDIRSQLATAHGSALRRRKLRRHVHECDGCRTFESVVLAQRRELAILLPVAPSVGLREAILSSIPGRDTGALATVGGAAATSAASGGAAGGGLAGSFAAIGAQGAAKLAVAGVVAVGGTGAIAAGGPAHVQHDSSTREAAAAPGHHLIASDEAGSPGAVQAPGAVNRPRPAALPPAALGRQAQPVARLDVPVDPLDGPVGAETADLGAAASRLPERVVSADAPESPIQHDDERPPPTSANALPAPGPVTKENQEPPPPAGSKKAPPGGHTPPGPSDPGADAPPTPRKHEGPKRTAPSMDDGDRGGGVGTGTGGSGDGDGADKGNNAADPSPRRDGNPHAGGGNPSEGKAGRGGNGTGNGDRDRDDDGDRSSRNAGEPAGGAPEKPSGASTGDRGNGGGDRGNGGNDRGNDGASGGSGGGTATRGGKH
jgi:RNA polymerase sigma factor (sigma-70 family)